MSRCLAPLSVPLLLAAAVVASACSSPSADLAPAAAPSLIEASAKVHFPDGAWRRGPAIEHGLAPSKLAELKDLADDLGSTCMVVIHDGVIVSEWYAEGYGPNTVHDNVFSITKSVVSAVFGIAQDRGLLHIDDPASATIAEWVGTPSETVTIRDLLSNISGRAWSMDSDYGALLFGEDQTSYGISVDQEHPRGTLWEYNNSAIQSLDRVFEVATGEDIEAFAQRELFDPIGMNTASFMRDAAGNALVYQGISSSCHDIARIGHLFAQQGQWAGEQVVSADWVAESTSPSSALNDGYGYLWWLNREGTIVEPTFPFRIEYGGQLVPGAPASAYAAVGAFGQIVVVYPDDGYVLVRLEEIPDLLEAIDTDPDPVGMSKLRTMMAAFEAARL